MSSAPMSFRSRARGWKDLRDLLADDPVPVPDDVIRQEIEKGGKRVQRPHGQARQEFDHEEILLQAAGDAGADSIDLVHMHR